MSTLIVSGITYAATRWVLSANFRPVRIHLAPGAHPLLVSHNLCPVRSVWATTGNQGCHSYSPVAHRLRNTRPKKAGSFLSVILRQTIIGGHGDGCQLHSKIASLCRFRATLNRYRPGLYRPFSADE